jgi:Fe-Mn family superoxide dismutase
LHEIFWENLCGDGDIEKAPLLKQKIISDFGSIQNWKSDLIATATSAKNSGWAVLAINESLDNKLKNFLVDEHGVGAVWGAKPLIALDMYEHAYYHKDGPRKAIYIENFLKNLNWKRIEETYIKQIKK